MLIVELAKLIPLILKSALQSLKAIQHRTLEISCWLLSSIHERRKSETDLLLEWLPCLFGSEFKTNHEKGSHKEACIGLLVILWATVMEDPDTLVLLVFQNSVEFHTVSMELSKVQRAKILIVALIDKNLINVKEEAIWHILWRIIIAKPV